MANWTWRRRNYLINKEFQLRYVGRIIFGMVAFALIMSFTVYYTTWARFMDEFYTIPRIAAEFAPLFASVTRQTILLVILSASLAAVISVFVSHSIAGPLFRFEKTLEAMAKGDLTFQIGLRKTDEFRHVAETINSSMEELRNKLAADNKLMQELLAASRRIRLLQGKAKKMPEALNEELNGVHKTLEGLKANLDQFKLPKA